MDALEQARIQVTDAVELMRQRLGSLEHDPARQEEIEGRLDSALQLARKHRVEPERLWSLAGVMDAELASIDSSNSRLEQVGADCARALTELREAAGKLSSARSKAARALATAVTRNLRALGMPGATFTVNVSPLGGRERGGADGAGAAARNARRAHHVFQAQERPDQHEPQPVPVQH